MGRTGSLRGAGNNPDCKVNHKPVINILEVNPGPNQAMSFYRGRLPFIRLQKKYSDQLMIHPYYKLNKPTWDYLLWFDLVFMQRPADEDNVAIAQACKRYNIPLWTDFDDLLTNIPADNPAHDAYQGEYQDNIEEIIRLSTVITVSTQDLKDYLDNNFNCGSRTVVIPNAFDSHTLPHTPKFKRSKKILWRGTSTHQKDLFEFKDEIVRVMNSNKKWTLDFMGYNPFFITEHIRHSYTPKMELDSYFEVLPRLNHSICIVPLHDCEFNRAKSNIGWQEATYAGAVCLAPDFEEWNYPGIINYTDQKDFEEKLTAMIKGEMDLKAFHTQSWQYINDHLSLDKINEERYKIIEQLTSLKQPQVQCTP